MATEMIVGVTEAHNRLSELISLVEEGAAVTISKHGRAVAQAGKCTALWTGDAGLAKVAGPYAHRIFTS